MATNLVEAGHEVAVWNRSPDKAADLVAAGAVVTEGMQIPPGSLAAGVPAKVRKELDEEVAVPDLNPDSDPVAQADARLLRDRLELALEDLAPRLRAVVVLRDLLRRNLRRSDQRALLAAERRV